MFTGIIRELGLVRRLEKIGPSYRLEIEAVDISGDSVIGGSVSVNGVCLTIVAKRLHLISFDVMEETLKRTSLAGVRIGERVNLEGALKAGGELGGHFVLGHVDCTGRIADIGKGRESSILIEFPEGYANLIAVKGSIAIDGISLTVGDAGRNTFKVYVIPHTLKVTNLGKKGVGDIVNLEFDIIGKYLARFDELKKGAITEGYLREKGFN